MKKLSILIFLTLSLFLGACGNQELTLGSTTSETEKVEAKDPETIENEFITAAADFSRENTKSVEKLNEELKYLDQVENVTWRVDVNSLLTDMEMMDLHYSLIEGFLSDDQYEKYDSTTKHYEASSDLINKLIDDITTASETYDKRKLEEAQKQLPVLTEELSKMREQLEIERYE